MEITNREQICATIGFGDNGDRTVAVETMAVRRGLMREQ